MPAQPPTRAPPAFVPRHRLSGHSAPAVLSVGADVPMHPNAPMTPPGISVGPDMRSLTSTCCACLRPHSPNPFAPSINTIRRFCSSLFPVSCLPMTSSLVRHAPDQVRFHCKPQFNFAHPLPVPAELPNTQAAQVMVVVGAFVCHLALLHWPWDRYSFSVPSAAAIAAILGLELDMVSAGAGAG